MTTLVHELRFAIRGLLRSPAYTLAAALTLALGIGATTALFSIVDSLLIRPLPFKNGDRLVVPVATNASRGVSAGSVSYPDYLDWKQARSVFEHVAVFWGVSRDFAGGGEPERLQGMRVSEEYFSVVGVEASIGRLFNAADHVPGAANVAVLSDGLYRRRFGADPSIVGRDVRLDGEPYTVVGVARPERTWPGRVELFLPLGFESAPPDWVMRRDNGIFQAIALLAPGTGLEEAIAWQELMGARVASENPESKAGWSYSVVPLREWIVPARVRQATLVLLGAVGFVLLIACSNVVNLTLARRASRERETAIRAALGAGRSELVSHAMAESLLVALVGGAFGLLLAMWGVDLIMRFAPSSLPRFAAGRLDGRVLTFTLLVSLSSALAVGVLPALGALGARLVDALRSGARASEGRRAARTRGALVTAEIALSLILVTGAGLMSRSLTRLTRSDTGVNTAGVATLSVSLPNARYQDDASRARFYARLLDEIRSAPGVASAAAVSALPLGGGGFYLGRSFLLESEPEPPAGPDHQAEWNVVTPDYFAVMGMRLLRGRGFTERDDATSPPVMIIDETMARSLMGGKDPIGLRIRSWRDENVLREIVGVVSDVRYNGVGDSPRPLVYVPHAQNSWGAMLLAVRARADIASILPVLRERLRGIDPAVAPADFRTMAEVAGSSMAEPRFSAGLIAIFAGVALLLALVGVFGLVSYSVEQRTQEIGVRMALGAEALDVVRLVAARGMTCAVFGVALGLAGVLAVGRVLSSLLFETSPTDAVTLSATVLLLLSAAATACVLPARRAMKLDPVTALRQD